MRPARAAIPWDGGWHKSRLTTCPARTVNIGTRTLYFWSVSPTRSVQPHRPSTTSSTDITCPQLISLDLLCQAPGHLASRYDFRHPVASLVLTSLSIDLSSRHLPSSGTHPLRPPLFLSWRQRQLLLWRWIQPADPVEHSLAYLPRHPHLCGPKHPPPPARTGRPT